MKTDALISMLATGPTAVDPSTTTRRICTAAAAGLVIATIAMLAALGPRADLAAAMSLPMFWMKLAVPLCLAIAFFVASARLARPGGRAKGAWVTIVAALVMLWTVSMIDLAAAPAHQRASMVEGGSALFCVVSIALLSLPLLLAMFVAMRGLGPTRLRAAGMAAGGLAGAAAALVYAVH
ncbi:MAG: DUF1109 domain-containing protein, partial [Pseudomonadota bacterium]|nr:DUF1109 domain-containing protein [Pseudomonadota bacterium]